MENEDKITQMLCIDCNDKQTCSESCYWYDHMIAVARWKDECFLEWLEEINTYTLHDKSKYIKLAIEKLKGKAI